MSSCVLMVRRTFNESGRNQEACINNVIPNQLSPQILVENEDGRNIFFEKVKERSKIQPRVQIR